MSTKQDLVEEYKAQMLRVYGMLPPNMAERIEAMSEEKLRRDLENIRAYPNNMKENLCPICGVKVSIIGNTKDGRLIGSCRDAFTLEQWTTP